MLDPERTLVVIAGASRFALNEFEDSGAFLWSAAEFRRYATESLGVPDKNVLWLFDEDNAVDQQEQMGTFLSRAFERLHEPRGARTLVMFVFVGHGAFFGREYQDYCLVVRDTRRPVPANSSLRVASLAELMFEVAPESSRILLLDCCFAGAAVRQFQAPVAQVVGAKSRAAVENQRGVALLCAASADNAALMDLEADRTMFSAELLSVLREGDANTCGPLSLRRVCELVRARLYGQLHDGAPRPEVHTPNQIGGDVAALALFPNSASPSQPIEKPNGQSANVTPPPDSTSGWELAEASKVAGSNVSFSPDGEVVAIPSAFRIQVVEARGKHKEDCWAPSNVTLAAPVFSADGRCIAAAATAATAGQLGAWVWDRHDGELLHEVEARSDREDAAQLYFSPRGHYFAAPQLDPVVRDTLSWRSVDDVDLRHPAAFGMEERLAVVASETALRFYALPDWELLSESRRGTASLITAVDAHPTDPTAFLVVTQTAVAIVRSAGEPETQIDVPDGSASILASFSPSGNYVVVSYDDHAHHYLHHADTGEATHVARFGSHRFGSGDRHLLVFQRGIAKLLALPSGEVIQSLSTRDDDGRVLESDLLGLSHDERFVATGRQGHRMFEKTSRVRLWDIETGALALEPDFPADWCALSPTEGIFAAVSSEEIRFYCR